MSNLKTKILTGLALTGVAITSFGGLVTGVAQTSAAGAMNYTGTLTDVMVAGDTASANALNNVALAGAVNGGYSFLNYCIQFFFQNTVLSVVIALMVISTIAGVGWHFIKRRSMGAM